MHMPESNSIPGTHVVPQALPGLNSETESGVSFKTKRKILIARGSISKTIAFIVDA